MRRSRFRQPVLFALLSTTILFGLAALAPRLADTYWLLELPAHLRAHLSVGMLVIVGVFAALKAWRHLAFAAVVAGVVAAPVAALWIPFEHSDQHVVALRALSLNVSFYGRNYDEVLALIQRLRPDVIGLVEVNTRWMEELAPIDERYRHRVVFVRPRGSGVALLSRLPLRDAEVRPFSGTGRHHAVGAIDVDDVSVVLAVAHGASPLGGAASAAVRNGQLETLAAIRQEFADREVLIMGDLNTSPWSLAFQRLLDVAGFRDAATGFGYRPTWPAQQPWIGIPIDHHVVSGGIVVKDFSIVGPTGSDHLAVYSELGFRERQ